MLKNWAMYRMMCVVAVFTSHCILNIQWWWWIEIEWNFKVDDSKLSSTLNSVLPDEISSPNFRASSNKIWNLPPNVTYSHHDDDVFTVSVRLHSKRKNFRFSSRVVVLSWKMFQSFLPRPLSSSLTQIFTVYTYDIWVIRALRAYLNSNFLSVFFSPVM